MARAKTPLILPLLASAVLALSACTSGDISVQGNANTPAATAASASGQNAAAPGSTPATGGNQTGTSVPTPGAATANPGAPATSGPAANAGTSGTASAPVGITPFEQNVINVVERAMPAVVGIGVESRHAVGLGSGFIIDPNGYIVTNAHVVAAAQRVAVALTDGRSFAGTVMGSDPANDLAMVKIEATGLPTLELGDSSTLRPGQTAIAIGNPLGYARTVTLGVVSATGRSVPEDEGGQPIQDMVQTSAAINPGNSGGPLLDSSGRVIGVNTLGAADPQTGGRAEGIGFAVSVNTVKRLVPGWLQQGQVSRTSQPWIGVSVVDVDPAIARRVGLPVQQGVLVASLVPFGPAEQAGLQAGDVIIAIDGKAIRNGDQLKAALTGRKAGEQVSVTFVRSGAGEQTKTVTLGG